MLEEVGGTAYFAQLLMAMVGIINAGEYGKAVHDAWLRRQLIDIGEVVVNNAFGLEAELDGRQQIELAESELFRLATQGGNDGGFVTFERALTDAILGAERAFRRAGHVSGLSTGPARPGQEDRRPAPLRPDDPCRPALAWARRRWPPRSPSVPRTRWCGKQSPVTRTPCRKARLPCSRWK